MNAQQNPGGGAPLSAQKVIDTDSATSFADFITQPLMPILRSDVGCKTIRPGALLVMSLGALAGAEGLHHSLSPLVELIASGSVMSLKQRWHSWRSLKAGTLSQPYSRGTSRLGVLLKFNGNQKMEYFRDSLVRRWGEPGAVAFTGYVLLHLGIGGWLGWYLLIAGVCLRKVESAVYAKEKEIFLDGAGALAEAYSQSAVTQAFHNPPAPERRSEAPAAGLSTGVGNDLAGKVAELKAKAEREGWRNPPGGGIAAAVLMALLLPGMSRAASVPTACACAGSGKGAPVQRAVLRTPLEEGTFVPSSAFGLRMHPVRNVLRWHAGIDLAAPVGTPIHAAADGVVVAAGRYGCDGNYVRLAHADGVMTSYSHAVRIARGIVPGARVRQGQVISWVGSTGCSTGSHLHYQVWLNGERVNPALVCHLLALSSGCYRFPPPPERRRTPVLKRA